MYKRVLLAYDGTLPGARALREGALLAKACGAEVFLLCVVPQTAGILMAESGHCGVLAQQRQEYEDLLKRAVERLKALGFTPTAWLMEGEPSPVIAAAAKKADADLVVVGHHSQGFLTRWWSGSRQDYLTDLLGCSVLVARNPISDEAFEAELARGAVR